VKYQMPCEVPGLPITLGADVLRQKRTLSGDKFSRSPRRSRGWLTLATGEADDAKG
jgi:hypothetical protein